MPSSSTVDLRPLTTSELIDRGFALYRSHFTGLLLLALICQAAPLVMSQLLVTLVKLNPTGNEFVDNPQLALSKLGGVLVIYILTLIITFCFDVLITFYIADAYLGKSPSVKASLRRFVSKAAAAMFTSALNIFLMALSFLFPLLAYGAAYLYLLHYPPADFFGLILIGIGALVLFVASLVPVLVVFMRLMLTVPAVALEGLSGWKALRRSSTLVRYDPGLGILYWGEMRLSFLLLPLFAIELMGLSLTSLPLTLHQLSEAMRHGSGTQMVAPTDTTVIVSQLLTFLLGSLILPLYAIAITLFYYDVRIRREGFDLEFMAGQLEANR